MEAETLLTAEEVAEKLHLRPSTIRAWARGKIIPTVYLGTKVRRFRLSEVVAAKEAQHRNR